ncbi:MAG: methyltransferase [Candidatus Omnitrophica bacterium]|nr:methyltransferase [Candidatus Omnitrophota bacterium]
MIASFRQHIVCKVIALMVSFTFIWQSIGPVAKAEDAYAATLSSDSRSIDISSIKLPASIGEVIDSSKGNIGKTIIHIRDAHCDYSAQNSISGLVNYFRDKHGIKLVALEGGAGDYDLSVFTDIKDVSLREKTADYFVKQGEVNGAEFYAINNPAKVMLYGVEDPGLYTENLSAYMESLKFKDDAQRLLKVLSATISKLKSKIYPANFKQFDEKVRLFKEDKLSFEEYATAIADFAKKENINLSEYPNISRFYDVMDHESGINMKEAERQRNILIDLLNKKLSKKYLEELVAKTVEFNDNAIPAEEYYAFLLDKAKLCGIDMEKMPDLVSYAQCADKTKTVNKKALEKEFKSLDQKMCSTFLKTEEARELCSLDRRLFVLERMFSTTLVKDDWDYYSANREMFDTKNFPFDAGKGLAKLDDYRKDMEKFYDISLKRDDVFIDKIAARLKKEKQNNVVLVTGGFHQDNLKKLFESKGYSYVEVLPRIEKADGENHYFQLLSGGADPISRAISERQSSLQIATFFDNRLGPEVHDVKSFDKAVEVVKGLLSEGSADIDGIRFSFSSDEGQPLIVNNEQVLVDNKRVYLSGTAAKPVALKSTAPKPVVTPPALAPATTAPSMAATPLELARKSGLQWGEKADLGFEDSSRAPTAHHRKKFTIGSASGYALIDEHGKVVWVIVREGSMRAIVRNGGLLDIKDSADVNFGLTWEKGTDSRTYHCRGSNPRSYIKAANLFKDAIAPILSEEMGVHHIDGETPNETLVRFLQRYLGAKISEYTPSEQQVEAYKRIAEKDTSLADPRFIGGKWYKISLSLHQVMTEPAAPKSQASEQFVRAALKDIIKGNYVEVVTKDGKKFYGIYMGFYESSGEIRLADRRFKIAEIVSIAKATRQVVAVQVPEEIAAYLKNINDKDYVEVTTIDGRKIYGIYDGISEGEIFLLHDSFALGEVSSIIKAPTDTLNSRPIFGEEDLYGHGTNGYVLWRAISSHNSQLRPSDDLDEVVLTGESGGNTGLNRRFVSTVGLAYATSSIVPAWTYAEASSSGFRLTLDNIDKKIEDEANGLKALEEFVGDSKNIKSRIDSAKQRIEHLKKAKIFLLQLKEQGLYEEYLELSAMPVCVVGDGVVNGSVRSDIGNESVFKRVNIRAVGVNKKDVDRVKGLLSKYGVVDILVMSYEELQDLTNSYKEGNKNDSQLIKMIKARTPKPAPAAPSPTKVSGIETADSEKAEALREFEVIVRPLNHLADPNVRESVVELAIALSNGQKTGADIMQSAKAVDAIAEALIALIDKVENINRRYGIIENAQNIEEMMTNLEKDRIEVEANPIYGAIKNIIRREIRVDVARKIVEHYVRPLVFSQKRDGVALTLSSEDLSQNRIVELFNNRNNIVQILRIITLVRYFSDYNDSKIVGNFPFEAGVIRQTGTADRLEFEIASGIFVSPATNSFRRHLVYEKDIQGNRINIIEIKIPGDNPTRFIVGRDGFEISNELQGIYGPSSIIVEPAFVAETEGDAALYGRNVRFSRDAPLRIVAFKYADGIRIDNLNTVDDAVGTIINSIIEKLGSRHTSKEIKMAIAKAVLRCVKAVHRAGYVGTNDIKGNPPARTVKSSAYRGELFNGLDLNKLIKIQVLGAAIGENVYHFVQSWDVEEIRKKLLDNKYTEEQVGRILEIKENNAEQVSGDMHLGNFKIVIAGNEVNVLSVADTEAYVKVQNKDILIKIAGFEDEAIIEELIDAGIDLDPAEFESISKEADEDLDRLHLKKALPAMAEESATPPAPAAPVVTPKSVTELQAASTPAKLSRAGRVLRILNRDIVVVMLPSGKEQAFYRSTGQNSGKPGQWFPFDGISPYIEADTIAWFNKGRFNDITMKKRNPELYGYGTEELKRAGEYLDTLNVRVGDEVTEVRKINDFIGGDTAIRFNRIYDDLDVKRPEGNKIDDEIRIDIAREAPIAPAAPIIAKAAKPVSEGPDTVLAAGKYRQPKHIEVHWAVENGLPEDLRNFGQLSDSEKDAVKERYRDKNGNFVIPIKGLLEKTGLLGHIGLGRYYGESVIYMDDGLTDSEKEIVIKHELYEIGKWEAKRIELGLDHNGMRKWIQDNSNAKGDGLAQKIAAQWHADAPSVDPVYQRLENRIRMQNGRLSRILDSIAKAISGNTLDSKMNLRDYKNIYRKAYEKYFGKEQATLSFIDNPPFTVKEKQDAVAMYNNTRFGIGIEFLLDFIEILNDDELAAVIGHEFGHVQHMSERKRRYEREKKTSLAGMEAQFGQDAAAQFQRIVEQGESLSVNDLVKRGDLDKGLAEEQSLRDEEFCDTSGMFLMTKAGFDPSAGISAFEKLKTFRSDNKLPLQERPAFKTHPDLEKRIAFMEKFAQANEAAASEDIYAEEKDVVLAAGRKVEPAPAEPVLKDANKRIGVIGSLYDNIARQMPTSLQVVVGVGVFFLGNASAIDPMGIFSIYGAMVAVAIVWLAWLSIAKHKNVVATTQPAPSAVRAGREISRRAFLKKAALATAGVALGGGAAALLDSITATSPKDAQIEPQKVATITFSEELFTALQGQTVFGEVSRERLTRSIALSNTAEYQGLTQEVYKQLADKGLWAKNKNIFPVLFLEGPANDHMAMAFIQLGIIVVSAGSFSSDRSNTQKINLLLPKIAHEGMHIVNIRTNPGMPRLLDECLAYQITYEVSKAFGDDKKTVDAQRAVYEAFNILTKEVNRDKVCEILGINRDDFSRAYYTDVQFIDNNRIGIKIYYDNPENGKMVLVDLSTQSIEEGKLRFEYETSSGASNLPFIGFAVMAAPTAPASTTANVSVEEAGPDLIREAAKERAGQISVALAKLRSEEPQAVNIYIGGQMGKGVLGRMKLIANGLIDRMPNLKINIYLLVGVGTRDGLDDRIGFSQISASDLAKQELHKAASTHITTGEFSKDVISFREGDAVIACNTFPAEFGKKRRARGTTQKISSDLNDPFGTLYLDRGLYERHLARDSWAPDELIKRRSGWLKNSTSLSSEQRQALADLSAEEGWDPARAIWTSAYFQAHETMMPEMNNIINASEKLPFSEGGKQLVIHAVRGIRAQGEEFSLGKLIDSGVTIITPSGVVRSPDRSKRRPITIILYNNIDNGEFRSLISELNGTMVKSEKYGFFIDFPAFVTGGASWLEAVSSGSPYLHDDFNTALGYQRELVKSTLVKKLALEDKEGKRSMAELTADAEKQTGAFIAGNPDNIGRYSDLEGWTREAREYSDAMYRFNMIDDILIALAERISAPARSPEQGPGPSVGRAEGLAALPAQDAEIGAPLNKALHKYVADSATSGTRIADMGCGNGRLSVLCAQKGAEVDAIEISVEALKPALRNFDSSGLGQDARSRINPVVSDLFANLQDKKYSIIAFAPPLLNQEVPGISGAGAKRIAQDKDFDIIRRFMKESAGHLEAGGRIVLVYGYDEEPLDPGRGNQSTLKKINEDLGNIWEIKIVDQRAEPPFAIYELKLNAPAVAPIPMMSDGILTGGAPTTYAQIAVGMPADIAATGEGLRSAFRGKPYQIIVSGAEPTDDEGDPDVRFAASGKLTVERNAANRYLNESLDMGLYLAHTAGLNAAKKEIEKISEKPQQPELISYTISDYLLKELEAYVQKKENAEFKKKLGTETVEEFLRSHTVLEVVVDNRILKSGKSAVYLMPYFKATAAGLARLNLIDRLTASKVKPSTDPECQAAFENFCRAVSSLSGTEYYRGQFSIAMGGKDPLNFFKTYNIKLFIPQVAPIDLNDLQKAMDSMIEAWRSL